MQAEDKPLGATGDMAVEQPPVQQQQQQQQQEDQSAAKKLRTDEQTVASNIAVQPLREIDTTVDVNKLSGSEIKQQMQEIYEHAKGKGCQIEQLPQKERSHFYRLNLCLEDRASNAKRFFQELEKDGELHPADASVWVKMLDDNGLDPLAKDNIATYAAASKRYAKKKEDERDAALKRAHDAEEELGRLKANAVQQPAMAMGKPAISTFQQQIQQPAQQQQQVTKTHTPERQEKAVLAYYHKFGENDVWPYGQANKNVGGDSFAAMFSEATMRHIGGQPSH